MEFGKRHDTTDNGRLPAPTCHRPVTDLLRENWGNRFWPQTRWCNTAILAPVDWCIIARRQNTPHYNAQNRIRKFNKCTGII